MAADELPPQDKQGDVDDQHEHTDGDGGDKGVDHLAHAGNAAIADEVGGIEPVKGKAVQDRPHRDPEIGGSRPLPIHFF